MSKTCQQALSRNVSSSWLLSFIGLVLLHLFDQLLKSRELFGREMFRFHETHHETFRRAAEESIDNVFDVLADDLLATDGGVVKVRAILESSFSLALTCENVEHGLDGGIRELAFQFLLNCLDVCWTCFPEYVHDFELKRG